jgi:uncharacterized protein YyaL (SSP411 family)
VFVTVIWIWRKWREEALDMARSKDDFVLLDDGAR